MLAKSDYIVNPDAVLGSGSYGVVYIARQWSGAVVAAKRIDFIRNKEKLSQAAKDLNKLTELVHVNISRIFEVLQEENTIWVFMELCNYDLIKYLQPQGTSSTVSPAVRLKLMLDIAKGVEYMHSKNVIHRDIKPRNVLVSGNYPTAKLTDFDLCKFLEEDYSTSLMTSNVGTQAFKAPEFYLRTEDGELNYHRNVDVYAMGLTFLAMIQDNNFLVPKLETPNEPSELGPGYTIGMLMAERKRYKVKPLQVVKISPEGNDSTPQMRTENRGGFLNMLKRIRHGAKPREDESTATGASEPEHQDQLWNKVRRQIQRMTHVEPKERASASEVVQGLQKLTSTDKEVVKLLTQLHLTIDSQISQVNTGERVPTDDVIDKVTPVQAAVEQRIISKGVQTLEKVVQTHEGVPQQSQKLHFLVSVEFVFGNCVCFCDGALFSCNVGTMCGDTRLQGKGWFETKFS